MCNYVTVINMNLLECLCVVFDEFVKSLLMLLIFLIFTYNASNSFPCSLLDLKFISYELGYMFVWCLGFISSLL